MEYHTKEAKEVFWQEEQIVVCPVHKSTSLRFGRLSAFFIKLEQYDVPNLE